MPWEIEGTDEFQNWYYSLDADQQVAVNERVDLLVIDGPNLRGGIVKRIQQSRHHHMKELRCNEEGSLRVLFLFDPRRTGILLLGGDKTGDWNDWYDRHVPAADDLYDEYLADLRAEGLL